MEKIKAIICFLLFVSLLFGCNGLNTEHISGPGNTMLPQSFSSSIIHRDVDIVPSNTPTDSNLEKTAILLKEYTSNLDENVIVFSDTYDNGNLFAIVLRKLPTYKGKFFYSPGFYYVLNIGVFNDEFEEWEEMTAYPIVFLDGNATYNDEVDVTREGDTFLFKLHCTYSEERIYTLSFLGEQFILRERDSLMENYQSISSMDTGLLLGIEGDNLYSLFVFEEAGKLKILKKYNSIIVPTDDGFYNLAKFRYKKLIRDIAYGTNTYARKYLAALQYDDYFSYSAFDDPLEVASTRAKEYDENYDPWGFDTSDDSISFISNGFISYRNSYFWHGGGSGTSTTPTIYFDSIISMNNQRLLKTMDTMMLTPTEYVSPLIEYLSPYRAAIEEKANVIREEYDIIDKQIQEEGGRDLPHYGVSLDNLLLAHEAGKMCLKLAVESCVYAPNESPFAWYEDYIDLDIPLPLELTGENELCVNYDMIKKRIPEVIDAFSSPDGRILVVDTSYGILFFTRENTESNFVYSLPDYEYYKNEGDALVMAEWAYRDQVNRWKEEISRIDTSHVYYFRLSKGEGIA